MRGEQPIIQNGRDPDWWSAVLFACQHSGPDRDNWLALHSLRPPDHPPALPPGALVVRAWFRCCLRKLDDQKIFAWMKLVQAEFVIRFSHNRRIEVYNDRLDCWENELLYDLVATVTFPLAVQVAFTKARRVRVVTKYLGWPRSDSLTSSKCCGPW